MAVVDTRGHSSRHVPLSRLQAGFDALAVPAADRGTLTLIVRRLTDGMRDAPASAHLSEADGLVGDAWTVRPPRDINAQLTVMRMDVAELIANGQPLTLFGDNLLVDLDISAANLPPGSRLRVADCIVEVTPEPHTGCKTFKDRFGHDALKFVSLKPTRHHKLRGIHWRVIRPGVVNVGDSIEVLSRG